MTGLTSGEHQAVVRTMMDWYFVAGIAYSLAAMGLVGPAFVCLSLREQPRGLAILATILCWILVAASAVILYAHGMEIVPAFTSDSPYERNQFRYRIAGPHAWVFWFPAICYLAPQAFWLRSVRKRPLGWLVVSLIAIAPIVFERVNLSWLAMRR